MDTTELKRLWGKDVTASTMVWGDGREDWAAISDIPSLLSKLQPPAAPSRKAAPAPPPPGARKAAGGGGGGGGGAAGGLAKAVKAMTVGGWMPKMTLDGVPYYYNEGTEAVSWDKPDELKTAEEKKTDHGDWVWLRDDREAWVPATVLRKLGDGGAECQTRSGRRVNVSAADVKSGKEPLWELTPSSLLQHEGDLVMMDSLNEAMIIHNLKERYNRNAIYTWVGATRTVLISVNPFKMLPLYTPELIDNYAHPPPNKPLEPHVFAIAANCYKRMLLDGQNQSVLISGESGAGKTEATKQCLNYLADVAESDENLEQRILMANPVLEAFGNAKTLRNNNSSRFGKWVEVHFDVDRRAIAGARIDNYLLEKSRVVFQQANERNYHVFYQLCISGLEYEVGGRRSRLGRPEEYRYINTSGCITMPEIDDVGDFEEVQAALQQLGFSDAEKGWMFQLTAGVLLLGNVTFKSDGDQGSVIADASSLQEVADLFQVPADRLQKTLCFRSITVRGERSVIPLKPGDAKDACDALAKATYGKLFDWLVSRVNEAMAGETGRFIGVLDIFGFEIFETNSFEQLCINFANEKLQQHFNRNTFKEEEELYESEGIKYKHIEFIDNQPVLDLIEKAPGGVLVFLDDEVKLPEGSDSRFLEKISKAHAANKAFLVDRKQKFASATAFTVVHYAGAVQYDGVGFLLKNKDTLFQDAYDMMAESKSDATRVIFPQLGDRRKITSLSGQFRKQLASLMKLLYTTQPAYIRCIKPNPRKVANDFQAKMSIEQLRYSGVFEAVQIRKQGYPFRYTHKRFVARYHCTLLKKDGWVQSKHQGSGDYVAQSKEILEHLGRDDITAEVQIGRSMVLYRAEQHNVLELLRNLNLEKIVPVAQRLVKGGIARCFARLMREAGAELQKALDVGNDIKILDAAIKKAAEIIGPMRRLFHQQPVLLKACKTLRFKLEEWVKVTEILEKLMEQDVNEVYLELGAAIARADEIADTPHTDYQDQLYRKSKDMLENAAAAKIDPVAEEALYVLNKEGMQEVTAEAAKYSYVTPTLEEIARLLALPEGAFVKLQLKKAIELKDPQRQIHREIRLKQLYLEQHAAMFAFDRFSQLRDPQEYASAKSFFAFANKEALAAGMLKHSPKPIHISLTDLPPPLSKEAVKCFKNVLGYMGDRKYPNVQALAVTLMEKGRESPELRTELFCQVGWGKGR